MILDLKPVSIITVCKEVLPFNDPLPEDVFQKLFSKLLIEYAKGELDGLDLRNCRPLSEIDWTPQAGIRGAKSSSWGEEQLYWNYFHAAWCGQKLMRREPRYD